MSLQYVRMLCLALWAAAYALGQGNPLLEIDFSRNDYRLPFDAIRPEHVNPAVDKLLADAKRDLAALKASKGPRTWANTMEPLERLGRPLEEAFRVARILEAVASTPRMRAAYNKALPQVSAFFTALPLDAELAAMVREYAETPEAKALTGAQARYLKITLDEFRRNGAYLDPAKRARLTKINTELEALSTKFGENTLDATNAFELLITDEKQLAGLPQSAREAAAASAKAKGKKGWRFTLQAPSYLPLMRFLDDASIREKVYRAQTTLATSGATNNKPILARILQLRREKASLLGYQTFADFQTEDRMAKSGDNVKKFLGELEEKSRPFFDKENAELQAFRKSLEGPNAPPLQPWDIAYYAEKLRQRLYDLDDEVLRPYLPVDQVMSGMFALVNRLYGITVKPVENRAVWNPAVKYYEIRDRDGTLLAEFYADWHPRENKRSGAWMNPIHTGGPRPGGFERHVGMICGNMTPPVGDKPGLLTHREVETIYHEFGHLLHLALSRAPIPSLAGTSVAWDFVELPSQIMENFTWERASVDLFARHYQTGEVLPEDLFGKMLKARNFRTANEMMRQLSLGTIDIRFHTDYTASDSQGDPVTFARNIAQNYSPAPLPPDWAQVASFGHIFAGGYAAGYYSYKWSEVLDADAFSRFQREGVFSSEVGDAFRRNILEKGNTEDAGALFRAFMGRDPDVNALLRRSGLDLNQNLK
jgi:oligopeptidase A